MSDDGHASALTRCATLYGMTPSLRDRKKDATRQAIEDAAWALFTTQGFDETTIQQIADTANVAPRTFFRYFPNKESVLYPELDDILDEMAAAFAARPEGEPPLVSLLESINSVSEELSRNRSRQFERFQLLKHTGGGASSGFLNERVTKRVAEMIRERDADRPDCELRAQIGAGVLTSLMAISNEQWLSKGAEGDLHDEARHCFEIMRSLVSNEIPPS